MSAAEQTYVLFTNAGRQVLVRLDSVHAVEALDPDIAGQRGLVDGGTRLHLGIGLFLDVDGESFAAIARLRDALLQIVRGCDVDYDEPHVELLHNPRTSAVPPRRDEDDEST